MTGGQSELYWQLEYQKQEARVARKAAKKKKRKKKDPNSIPELTKRLDRVFSLWVRHSAAKDGWVKCYTCDHTAEVHKLHAGHYVPRQVKTLRWNPCNVHPQCYVCNMFYGGRPQDYRDALIQEYGVEDVEALEQMRHKDSPWTRGTLAEEIERYERLLLELGVDL